MRITSAIDELTPAQIRVFLDGLPQAPGYRIHVKTLRYRERPHLSAWTDFSDRSITLQVPEPFYPFGEIVPYGATRRPGAGKRAMRFIWLTEGLTFREPREVIRFLYCHEWMHWYLRERLGRKSSAETACDRFALHNYRRKQVTVQDAQSALRRRPDHDGRGRGPGR
jgi:hypothetical protein